MANALLRALGALLGSGGGAAVNTDQPALGAGFHSNTADGKAYRGASIDHLTRNWMPPHRSGDAMLADSWSLLTSRVSDLVRNEPSLGAAKRALVKNIVRTGIQTYADATDGEGESIDDFNFESDEWFQRWSDEEADAEHKHAFPELQWHAHDQTIEMGEAILLKCLDTSPGRTVPLCYQLLEPHQLDETKNEPAGAGGNPNRIVRGVELTARNVAVAYWIFDAHPYDPWSGWTAKSSRIPAERVIHYFVPMPQSATRGVCWFAALVRATRDADWFLGSEVTAAALGALLVFIHKHEKFGASQTGMGLADGQTDSDPFGNPLVKLGSGTKADIPQGDDIEVVESKRPGRQVGPFMELLRQEQAMGSGISYLSLTGDYSQTSFTSAHGAANDEDSYIQPLQWRYGRRLVKPVRVEHSRFAAAYGLYRSVSVRQFFDQPRRWTSITVQPPGRKQLDPLKQTEGSAARVRMGLSTLKDECGGEGKNWQRVILQRKREIAFAAKHGVELDFSKGASSAAGDDPVLVNDRRRGRETEEA